MSPKQRGRGWGGARQGVALEQIPQRDSLCILCHLCRRQIDFPIAAVRHVTLATAGKVRQRETERGRVRERETFACLHGSLLMCCCSVVIYAPARSFDMSKVVSPD